MCAFWIRGRMWVQLSASPASPVSENGEAGEAATCPHIRPQILKVHMVRCQGTSPGHFGPLNREFHFLGNFGQIRKGIMKMAKIWEPCFMCSKCALGECVDCPKCPFLLLARLRVLPAASSISEIEEAAGSPLVRAQIS